KLYDNLNIDEQQLKNHVWNVDETGLQYVVKGSRVVTSMGKNTFIVAHTLKEEKLKQSSDTSVLKAKINSSRNDPPNLKNQEVFAERNRPRKTDPPFEKLTVNNQGNSKLRGTTRKGRTTTAHVSKIKPLTQSFPLQDRPPPDPPDLLPGAQADSDSALQRRTRCDRSNTKSEPAQRPRRPTIRHQPDSGSAGVKHGNSLDFLLTFFMDQDEAIVSYFGRHSCKHFIKGKPIRWGYKLWVGALQLGSIVSFSPYQGASGPQRLVEEKSTPKTEIDLPQKIGSSQITPAMEETISTDPPMATAPSSTKESSYPNHSPPATTAVSRVPPTSERLTPRSAQVEQLVEPDPKAPRVEPAIDPRLKEMDMPEQKRPPILLPLRKDRDPLQVLPLPLEAAVDEIHRKQRKCEEPCEVYPHHRSLCPRDDPVAAHQQLPRHELLVRENHTKDELFTKNGAIVHENCKHNQGEEIGAAKQMIGKTTGRIPESVQAALPSVPVISIREEDKSSLSELAIDSPSSKTSSGKSFLLLDSGASDRNRILFFSTKRNREVLSSTDHWFCDGTFNTAPTLFTQLMTIHRIKFDAIIPLKSNLKQTTAKTDFESALYRAFAEIFDGIQLRGCFFHFGQCLWRQIQGSPDLLAKYIDVGDPDFALNV
ncbi:hypothetical protein ILUMI_10315, partial [Ignelater luminosus]